MKRQRWMFWAAMLAVSACGGNVDQSEDEAGGAAGTSSTAADGEAEEDLNTRQLGPCERGFDPLEEPERECAFLGDDGLCYDTLNEACNCVCPNSACAFGYVGNSDTPEVWCRGTSA